MGLSLLIHRYGNYEDIGSVIMDQSRFLVRTIENSDQVREGFDFLYEFWSNSTDGLINKPYQLFIDQRPQWKSYIEDRLVLPNTKQYFSFSILYTPHKNQYKLSRINCTAIIYSNLNCSYIEMTIPPEIQKCMDLDAFLKVVKQACSAIKATYACVDRINYCPQVLAIGHFYKYSLGLKMEEAYEYLPGLYWAQYFSKIHVQRTGNLSQILAGAPCPIKEILVTDDKEHEGIWLQMGSEYKKAPYKKMLAMRDYFQKSVPTLSIDKVAESIRKPWSHYDLKFFPFTEEEKKELIARGYSIK